MSSHTYYMTQRPPSPGCQPSDGLVEVQDYGTKKLVNDRIAAWGEATYNRALTAKEVADYELQPAPNAQE